MRHGAADARDFALGKGGRVLRHSVGATREEVRSAERAEFDQGIHIDATVPIGEALFRAGYVGRRMATQRFGKVWFAIVSLLADFPDHWKAMGLRTKVTRDLNTADIGDDSNIDKQYLDGRKLARLPEDDRVALLGEG
jgi:hypothetical protein